jgi:membrane-associated phospholipid phosphatase
MSITAAPNGVPSVHASTALLVLWFSRSWTPFFISGWIFLALTALATLGSGQHYLFDLFCAVPYAALVIWISDKWLFGYQINRYMEPECKPRLLKTNE